MAGHLCDARVPNLQGEVDRKALETLDWLILSVHQGRLTLEQFSTGVDALFMAVGGLADKDFFEACTATANETKALDRAQVRHHFVSETRPEVITTLAWRVGDDYVSVIARKGAEIVSERTIDCSSAANARTTLEDIAINLTNKGFVRI